MSCVPRWDLARIGDGFFAHGETTPQALPAPTTVDFCRAAPREGVFRSARRWSPDPLSIAV
jgi:hypothetical protein